MTLPSRATNRFPASQTFVLGYMASGFAVRQGPARNSCQQLMFVRNPVINYGVWRVLRRYKLTGDNRINHPLSVLDKHQTISTMIYQKFPIPRTIEERKPNGQGGGALNFKSWSRKGFGGKLDVYRRESNSTYSYS